MGILFALDHIFLLMGVLFALYHILLSMGILFALDHIFLSMFILFALKHEFVQEQEKVSKSKVCRYCKDSEDRNKEIVFVFWGYHITGIYAYFPRMMLAENVT